MGVIRPADLMEHPLQVDTGSDNHYSRRIHSLESDCGCKNRLRLGEVVHGKQQNRDGGSQKSPNKR